MVRQPRPAAQGAGAVPAHPPPPPAAAAAPAAEGGAGLAAKVAFLCSPAAYPGAPEAVEVRETHMSWVFLAGGFAYKLKKPVRHAFLDYRSLARRRHFCEEELRLNRRLAPSVYLDLVALTRRAGDAALQLGGAAGEVVDWLVRMRRLPEAELLDEALRRGSACADGVARAAGHLAAFYAAAPPVRLTEDAYLGRFAHELALNRALLHDGACGGLPRDLAGSLLTALDGVLTGERGMLLARLGAGRIVEGHGDLRPEHVFLGTPPAVIDCLEFDRSLRLLDPFEELAFLAMECALIPGGGWAGTRILEHCAGVLGERPPERLLAFYTAFRACLRARLCIAHLQDPAPREPEKWRPKALRYLDSAAAAVATLRRPPRPPAGR